MTIEVHHLRHLTDEQVGRIAAIYAECFSGSPWFEDWSEDAARTEISSYLEKEGGAHFYLGSVDGRLSGFAIAVRQGAKGEEDEQFWISEVAVDRRYQKLGLATTMVQRVVHDSISNGDRAGRFGSRTRYDNIAMIRVFEKCGFVERSRQEVVTGGKCSERIVFEFKSKRGTDIPTVAVESV